MVLNTLRAARTFLFPQRHFWRTAATAANMNTKDARLSKCYTRSWSHVYDELSTSFEACDWKHLVITVILIPKLCFNLLILHKLFFFVLTICSMYSEKGLSEDQVTAATGACGMSFAESNGNNIPVPHPYTWYNMELKCILKQLEEIQQSSGVRSILPQTMFAASSRL